MGTISDKLMRIINTKEDIRQALILKGYDVPTSIPFKEYAKMISDLPCKVDDFPKLPGDVIRWHFGGLTNEMMAAMDDPRIEDADGKGRFLSFKNFAWGGMSGVGGYEMNFNLWTNNVPSIPDISMSTTTTSVSVSVGNSTYNNNLIYIHMNNWDINKNHWLKVTSTYEDGDLVFKFYNDNNSKNIELPANGYVNIPAYPEFKGNYMYISTTSNKQGSFTIEQLPLYPGFILGDGVDDFAVTEKELNFEDTYTVYTAFIPFQNNPTRNMILCGADSKKTFSMQYSSLVYVSFIAGNNYYINADFVNGLNLFACKRNGNNICIKNLLTNKVVTGTCGDWVENAGPYYLWKNATYASFAKAAIAGQTICNGYFSTDEDDEKVLDWYKKQYPWLFPDQAWTVTGKTNEDEDRATIANITGNGNDLVLSNFGFAEGSGYGLYAQNYISYAITNRAVYTKTNSSIHVTKSITAGVNFTESARDVTIPSYRIKVTGIQSGQEMIYRGSNNTFLTNIPSDGIYVLPAVENGSNLGFQFVSYTGDCDITIEQIPEYEGYLVTDGVDDRVQDSSFKLNKDWTLVGEWVFLNQKATNAGITKPFSFVVYNRTTGLSLFINTGTSGITIENVKSIKAICSDGRIYFDDWSEMLISKDQDITSSTSVLSIGFNGTAYTQMAFKNLGIYNNQLLSKDDCIKAYNYLQTLKSK
mgnify:CR=1 FL=1